MICIGGEQYILLSEKKTNLLSLRWSKGFQNAACWGSEKQAEGWGHPGCRGLGTAGIKAHWTGYSPNCFSHWSPDLPSCCCCPFGAPRGHNSRTETIFHMFLHGALYLVSYVYATQFGKQAVHYRYRQTAAPDL